MPEKADTTKLDYIVGFGGGAAIPFFLIQVLWAWLSLISFFFMALASTVDAIATIGYFLVLTFIGEKAEENEGKPL